MVNNYPDDIRRHDDNPDSPFYDDSREEWIESTAEEIKNELLSDAGYRVPNMLGEIRYGIDDVIIEIICEDTDKQANYENALLNIITDKPNAVAEFKTIMDEFALQLAKQLAADELAAKENDCGD